jgi:hypothetical protein
MTCRYSKKVEKYHNGRLDEQGVATIENHLETCDICSGQLNELKRSDQLLSKIKSIEPQLANPFNFRNEILANLKQKNKRSYKYDLMKVFDTIIYILLQPATRYSFISAAMVFFGIFVYQQSIIVQKIDTLEQRMEFSAQGRKSKSSDQDNMEILSRYKDREEERLDDIENLLDNYQLLQIKYRFLIRTLKEKYPDTYNEIARIIEEEKSALVNSTSQNSL